MMIPGYEYYEHKTLCSGTLEKQIESSIEDALKYLRIADYNGAKMELEAALSMFRLSAIKLSGVEAGSSSQ